jgi:predicted nucleotidyltransferase
MIGETRGETAPVNLPHLTWILFPLLMPVTDEHIETAKAIARDYGATRMVVFGSAVDDPENARDLDLAIEGVEGGRSGSWQGRSNALSTFLWT